MERKTSTVNEYHNSHFEWGMFHARIGHQTKYYDCEKTKHYNEKQKTKWKKKKTCTITFDLLSEGEQLKGASVTRER